MKAFLLSIAALAAVACNQPAEEPESAAVPVTETETRKSTQVLTQTKTHIFSDPNAPDTFKIVLEGDSLLNAAVTFDIVSHTGQRIYHETFTSDYLIGFGVEPGAPPAELEAVIRKRILEFFDEKNFIQPAIKSDMAFDPNYSDKQAWNEVKAYASSVGFMYLLGKEDGRRIAWSPTSGKVVMYFNCC
ncbi:MAG: hypothetical protein V4616_02290 [Bacteroidota bacterium]